MLKFKIRLILLVLFSLLTAQASVAESTIYLKVGEARVKKSLLALTPLQFYGNATNSTDLKVGQDLYNIMYNDLNTSGLFQFVLPTAYLEDINKVGLKPAPGTPNGFNFANWHTIGTEFLVRGGYNIVKDKISLEIYVYYVPQAKLVFGKTYEGSRSAKRKISHTFSADMLKELTGVKGMYNSKIVVSSNRGATNKRGSGNSKEIYVMDWDGANSQKISNHRSIATSPAWSPDSTKIGYTAYAYHPKSKTRNADLFIYELPTGKRWLVSYRKGINSGANFLPDNKHLLLTLSQKGSPDIFKMSTDGRTLTRITRGPNRAMNVEPAVSPDGKHIAFSSDRSGKPMIYIMNINGSGVRRLTYAGKYNSTPTWSPDGKKIAFASFDPKKLHFDVFIINKDGSSLKRLTSASKTTGRMANNEEPTFAPDGRHIMFVSDRTGNRQLYLINPDGTNERRVTHDNYDYFKPKWSNYID